MFSWIFCIILAVWCVYQRSKEGGKIEGMPLGMPRGTVRAFITLLLVAFPIGYLLAAQTPPSLVISSLFLLVAFYFEARKGGQDRINRVLKEVRKPEKFDEADQKKPLYLPKYTVRLILILLLMVILLINFDY